MIMRLLMLAAVLVGALLPITQTQVSATITPILIGGIKTDGANTNDQPLTEYVEVYNPTAQDVGSLEGWQIEYVRSAPAGDSCHLEPWVEPLEVSRVDLAGNLPAKGVLHIPVRMLDDVGGSVRLSFSEGESLTISDVVGWGSDSSPSYCFEANPASIPGGDQLLRRCIIDEEPSDSNDNAADFVVTTLSASPPICLGTPQPSSEPYSSLVISELLPDPASPKIDSNDEFIELHNPNSFDVHIKNYKLQTGSSSSTYEYTLPDITLSSGEYHAFYASETKLTLVNSTGYARIIDPNGVLLHETDHYNSVGTEKAWALFGAAWQVTNRPTPSAANIKTLVSSKDDGEENSLLEPCGEGKYRNPATNRCKSVDSDILGLIPCQPGQTRNPDSNRCRSASGLGSVLTACKPDQQRNPATNRCRKVAGENVLKACQPGHERSSDTNRCRKVNDPLASSASTVGDLAAAGQKFNLALLGGVSAAALGYGGYEYRNDIRHSLARLRARFSKPR